MQAAIRLRSALVAPLVALAFALGFGAIGCELDRAPDGLRQTPPGDGPRVRFEPTRRPLPDIPLPNDVATFADPTSRTGRRIDLSLVADTAIERALRAGLSELEGWGVTAPITVSFDRSAGADPRRPALDLDAVADRMNDDEHDPTDDPFYVVDLATGVPVLLDVESGFFPAVRRDGDAVANAVFATADEGDTASYAKERDRDFDGLVDRPNDRPGLATRAGTRRGIDDLVTWYERESDTLVLRPLVPLEEKHEYAVVLTDRLRGPDGQPVRSPMPAIHHPTQRAGVKRLQEILADREATRYFGDIGGTGLDRVAFAWTFTTQPTHEDLRILREGLGGKGPFAYLGDDYGGDIVPLRAAGPVAAGPPVGWESSSPACAERAKTPYVVKLDADVREALAAVFERVFGLAGGRLDAARRSLDFIDHLVLGVYSTPYLLGDPAAPKPDARFSLDLVHGRGDVRPDAVPVVIAVPRAKADLRPPWPAALYSHGPDGNAVEALLLAGEYARQGVALVARHAHGHGLVTDDETRRGIEDTFRERCLAPFATALFRGRASTTNAATTSWSARVARTRDAIRQDALDGFALLHVLRSFDGRAARVSSAFDGRQTIAGDFDQDGTVDVGGPRAPYFTFGDGPAAAIVGAIDPAVVASAPTATATAIVADVVLRGTGLPAFEAQLFGPRVLALPATERPATDPAPSRCTDSQRSLRLAYSDGVRQAEVELECLDPSDLGPAMTVVVTNVTSRAARCARSGEDGRFAIPIPTNGGDRLDVQVYTAADAVDSYATCAVPKDAPVGRRVRDVIAPAEGLGLRRQSAELRRFRDLAQVVLDPADPAVFAPFFARKPLLDGASATPARALLAVSTIGDETIPTAASLSFARAAGALPFLPPNALTRFPAYADHATPQELYDRLGRRAPMRFLVENHVAEGVSRLARTSAGARCRANVRPGPRCAEATLEPGVCAAALFDPDWLSEGTLPFDAPHPDVPLRLARIANVRVTDAPSLAFAWEPRLRGTPFAADEAGWTSRERVVGLLEQYVAPGGAHGWGVADDCLAFDTATYTNALIARFFASGGKDLYYLSHPTSHRCLATATCPF